MKNGRTGDGIIECLTVLDCAMEIVTELKELNKNLRGVVELIEKPVKREKVVNPDWEVLRFPVDRKG